MNSLPRTLVPTNVGAHLRDGFLRLAKTNATGTVLRAGPFGFVFQSKTVEAGRPQSGKVMIDSHILVRVRWGTVGCCACMRAFVRAFVRMWLCANFWPVLQ